MATFGTNGVRPLDVVSTTASYTVPAGRYALVSVQSVGTATGAVSSGVGGYAGSAGDMIGQTIYLNEGQSINFTGTAFSLCAVEFAK